MSKNDDLLDDGLRNVMGDHIKEMPTKQPAAKKSQSPQDSKKTPDGEQKKCQSSPPVVHYPFEHDHPSLFDKLKECAVRTTACAVLCGIFFYWQQNGMMDPMAAMPCMCVCHLVAGIGIGKTARK